MKVVFLKSFFNDIKKIKDLNLKSKIKAMILDIENAERIEDIKGIKKMSGFAVAYRIRIGAYRVGLYFENNQLELARFVKRSDIYQVFP